MLTEKQILMNWEKNQIYIEIFGNLVEGEHLDHKKKIKGEHGGFDLVLITFSSPQLHTKPQ